MATYTGKDAQLVVSSSNTDVSDGTVSVTITRETEIPTVQTFGGQRSAQGTTTEEGEIVVVYDDAASDTGYSRLITEAETPTSGGYPFLFYPAGSTSGREEISGSIVVGLPTVEVTGEGTEIQTRTFPFTFEGSSSRTTV